jgi:cell division protein FtsB
MFRTMTRPGLGPLVMTTLALLVGGYFAFAAVQGEYGVFRQVQLSAERDALKVERDRLAADLADMQNLTRRLSDQWLDLDLLDERARDVLGYLRGDEIVIR